MAAAELVKRGYIVARPLTNGAAYDLLVDTGSRVVKVQVKRASRLANGSFRIKLTSSKYHRGRQAISYAGRVDCVLGVECSAGLFFIVHGEDLDRSEIAIRDAQAKHNQARRVRKIAEHDMSAMFPIIGEMVGRSGFEPLTPCV